MLASVSVLLDRLALHAHRLKIPHPVTGELLDLVSPLPEDMQAVIDAYGQVAHA